MRIQRTFRAPHSARRISANFGRHVSEFLRASDIGLRNFAPAPRAAFLLALLLAVVLPSSISGQLPPPGVPTGSTLELSLRYASVATREQAVSVRNTASAWTRAANSRNYRIDQFQSDMHSMQLQLSALEQRFAWMAGLAIQSGRPRAQNAAAELGAGINLIAELLYFLDRQYAAGTLDQATLVRTCRAFETAAREWEIEFRKSAARMGVVY